MKPHKICLILGLILPLIGILPLRSAGQSKEEIEKLILQLDSKRFRLREQATQELKKLGRKALPELKAALKNAGTQELKVRLRILLKPYEVRFVWFSDYGKFKKLLGKKACLITFDDINTGNAGTVPFAKDHYAKAHAILISGKGGQFASKSFGFPKHFRPVSGLNMYAPGPIAPRNAGKGAGGYQTYISFYRGKKYAATAGFGTFFIDADYPLLGPSSLRAISVDLKKESRPVSSLNGQAQFLGVLAMDGTGALIPNIAKIEITNGCNWPGADGNNAEGVALDNFIFAEPILIPGPAPLRECRNTFGNNAMPLVLPQYRRFSPLNIH